MFSRWRMLIRLWRASQRHHWKAPSWTWCDFAPSEGCFSNGFLNYRELP